MLSAENIAVVKLATLMCNAKELKRDIFCTNRTDAAKGYSRSRKWNETVEMKSKTILKSVGLPCKLHDKVTGAVLKIGREMLIWTKYHEEIVGISREFAVEFLKGSFFTQFGTIDSEKVVEELMNNRSLSVKQKYTLACLHYRVDDITALDKKISDGERKQLHSNDQCPSAITDPVLVRLLSPTGLQNINPNIMKNPAEFYTVEQAVKSGSVEAVKRFVEETGGQYLFNLAVKSAAEETLRIIKKMKKANWDDWFLLEDKCCHKLWIPQKYYVDILSFLLPRMSPAEKVEFLKHDLENIIDRDRVHIYEVEQLPTVLESFLNWPYQDSFMKTANLVWNFLPKRTYCHLLKSICEKIEPEVDEIMYGEEKIYDYRRLLKEFWCESPEDFKRFVFSSDSMLCWRRIRYIRRTTGAGLLSMLLKLRNFTREDWELIQLILRSATEQEKEDIFLSPRNEKLWIRLIRRERWEVLHRMVPICFSSKEVADKFKKSLFCSDRVRDACMWFLEKRNCSALESLEQWIALPQEEIRELKRSVGFSDIAKYICRHFEVTDDQDEADAILRWWCLSEEEVRDVKRKALYSSYGKEFCRELCFRRGGEKVKQVCKRLLSSEEEVINFRKELVSIGSDENHCETLVSIYGTEFVGDFLNLCILPQDQLKEFKRYIIYSSVVKRICRRMCLKEGVEKVNKFLELFLTTEEEARHFRKELIFTKDFGKHECADLLRRYTFSAFKDFIDFCLISEESLKELKEYVASEQSVTFCTVLIVLSHLIQRGSVYESHKTIWEDVEKFLDWCFPPGEEIRKFKFKNRLLPAEGAYIHSELIKSIECSEAETIFAWLDLSSEEIKQLQKDTLSNETVFWKLQRRLRDVSATSYNGWEKQTMEVCSRWFISGNKAESELKDILKCLFLSKDESEFCRKCGC